MSKTLVIGLIKENKMKIQMSKFRIEKMPAILGWKKCRQFQVGKKMPTMLDRNKMSTNLGQKNSGKFGPKKKMPVFSSWYKFVGKPAIAGELIGLQLWNFSKMILTSVEILKL